MGAPFFKRDDKVERSQSSAHKTETRRANSKKTGEDKGFNFKFFLPEQETFNEHDENEYSKTDVEAIWRPETDRSFFQAPPYMQKLKFSKRNREYSKSLKQVHRL